MGRGSIRTGILAEEDEEKSERERETAADNYRGLR